MRRLADWLSRALEPEEREAVCGDFAESDAPSAQKVLDILGLIARRQADLWMDWRPWLVLVTVVVPLSVMLALAVDASDAATTIWMYVHNWTPTHLESPGARNLLLNQLLGVATTYLVLACWSWAAGFIVGSLSGRTAAVSGAILGLAVLFAGLVEPSAWRVFLMDYNAPVYSQAFYRAVLPWLLRILLVVPPVLLGVLQARRIADVPRWLRVVLLALAAAPVAMLVMRNWGWALCAWDSLEACRQWRVWVGYARLAGVPLAGRPLLVVALAGPIGYAAAQAIWRRWSGRAAV